MRLSAAALATLFILVILWDAFETIVLSRRVSRRFRLTRAFYRLLWTPWRAAAKDDCPRATGGRTSSWSSARSRSPAHRAVGTRPGRLLRAPPLGLGSQLHGPPSGSGIRRRPLHERHDLLHARPGRRDADGRSSPALLTVLEAGMGFAFLALVIGYLPLISQAFSRREVSISMLDARAGSPPTAAQLLRRHGGEGGDDLLDLLRDWERWSAELLESHVSFPVLSYFRSQHDNQSWVAALTTILDACALIVARIDERPVTAARLTFAMARHAVVDLCAVFRLEPASPPRRSAPGRGREATRERSRRGGYSVALGRGVCREVHVPAVDVRTLRPRTVALPVDAVARMGPSGSRAARLAYDRMKGADARRSAAQRPGVAPRLRSRQPARAGLPRSGRDAAGRCPAPTARPDAAAAWRGTPADTAAARRAAGTGSRAAAAAATASPRP